MTTISINEETRKELLKIAGEIQAKTKKRVDFDKVIRFLIDVYELKEIDRKQWEKFTTPIHGIDFDVVYSDLVLERRSDEKQKA
ncbi:MAG: hypothetical protein P1Q69_18605 [Candidatus Thorarchaeota archaeon]|nr:hypothetical protein [Candidatus Thorarchaeota archaeon]